MEAIQLEKFNYTFEEREILKTLAIYADDPPQAMKFIFAGLDEYYHNRIKEIFAKFRNDGIWDLKADSKGNWGSTFTADVKEDILSTSNPIPETIKRDIDPFVLMDKLSTSNLDLSDVEYIKLLIKRDAAG